jgi:hypothetical protein
MAASSSNKQPGICIVMRLAAATTTRHTMAAQRMRNSFLSQGAVSSIVVLPMPTLSLQSGDTLHSFFLMLQGVTIHSGDKANTATCGIYQHIRSMLERQGIVTSLIYYVGNNGQLCKNNSTHQSPCQPLPLPTSSRLIFGQHSTMASTSLPSASRPIVARKTCNRGN